MINPAELASQLIKEGLWWVQSEREFHRPDARPLPETRVSELERFFHPSLLRKTRIKSVKRIQNPLFYSKPQYAGLPLIDFTIMSGITFVDTILIATELVPDPPPDRLLFHELVHVVQYHQMGLEEFVKRYVYGWLNHGMDYNAIPIERDALELDRQYSENPSVGFSIGAHVIRQLDSY